MAHIPNWTGKMGSNEGRPQKVRFGTLERNIIYKNCVFICTEIINQLV